MRKIWFFMILGLWYSGMQKSLGQNIAVGQWKAHLSQNDPLDFAFAAEYVYGWTEDGFFRYHLVSKETQALSKIDGYSDVGVNYAAYHDSLKTFIIAYQNGNIDLQINQLDIINVRDILNATVNGSKEINSISLYNQYAFFSCGFGILAYDLSRRESSADYQSNLIRDVRASVVYKNHLYAATGVGLYRAPLPTVGVAISASTWTWVDSGDYKSMQLQDDLLYLVKDTSAFSFDGSSMTQLLSTSTIRKIKKYEGKVYLTADNGVYILNETGLPFVSIPGAKAVSRRDNVWYYASSGFGVIADYGGGNIDFLSPGGPYAPGIGKFVSVDNILYVGGGNMRPNGDVTFSFNGFYTYKEGEWRSSVRDNIPYLDSMFDIHATAIDPQSKDVWVAGLKQGIVRVRGNQVMEVHTPDNSPLKTGISQLITSMAVDDNRNLWVANFLSGSPLLVKSPGGVWDSFPGITPQGGRVLDLLIDKSGQKWMRFGGDQSVSSGILVYGDNRTPFNKADDPFPAGKVLSSAGGNGGLPSNQVNCMALDRNGQIWVGTDKGLTVFYSPSNILNSNASDARQIVVGSGNDVGYLLGDDVITAILVDGGNRKWIASGSGLWLVSPDGQEVLAHYNENNSPLFSNEIKELGMVEATGELFIATAKGLMSLGTASSQGSDIHGNVKVYPNPVRPNYEGEIAISGLPQDAYVKITDIAGNLIYETRANGGTANWNGRSFDGRKAASGVYLIFTSNEEGTDSFVSKLLIVN